MRAAPGASHVLAWTHLGTALLAGLAGAGAVFFGGWLIGSGLIAGALAGAVVLSYYGARRGGSSSDLQAITTLMVETSEESDIDKSLRKFLKQIRSYTQAKYAAVSVFDEDDNVEKFITLGMSAEDERRIGRLPSGEGLLGYIHQEQEVLRISDMSEHRASAGFPEGHPPMTSLLAAPIVHQGRAVGSLYLSDKRRVTRFSAADERFVRSASQAAAVLINEKYLSLEHETVRAYLQEETTKLIQVMERLAEGDFTVEVEPGSRDDEIARLKRATAAMVDRLRHLIGQVTGTVRLLTGAAGQIAGATDQLAAGAEEQSAQADEVAAAMEEMSRTIIDNAKSATHTAQIAEESGETARENGEVVMQAVEKMRDIGSVVTRSAETIDELGSSSEAIGEIVATIDEIADQTNLLALNAAIEAARAGEHGKGFAVVADEVRNLAERTAHATAEIESMIGAIQDETQDAVHAVERGREEVSEGLELADRAGQAFTSILEDVTEVAGQVDSIAAATEEQSTTSEQVSRNIEAISTVSGESARGVSDIARTASELDALTSELKALTGTFTVEDEYVELGADAASNAGAPAAHPSSRQTALSPTP